MEIIKIKGTIVLEKILEAAEQKYRIFVLEGGTGSSKTYSLAQAFILMMMKEEGQVFTIARKTMPALKATAMRNFFNILKEVNLYDPEKHNKTDNIYNLHNNLVEFISVEDPQRVRSRRRQYLWLNEAIEFSLEDWRQLSMRTDKAIFLDYNPSNPYSWIYDEIFPRNDKIIISSTYKDNPFLHSNIIREIEHYKEIDENYWRIYGLGLKGIIETLIISNWDYCDDLPEGIEIYGLDFGYNSPSALIKIVVRDEGFYLKELLYKKYLTNQDLIRELREIRIPKEKEIYCDSAEPQRIKEIKDAGFWALSSDKDVNKGIDTMKSRKIYITKSSLNLIEEIKRYSWKEKDGKLLDEPVALNDHLLSAARYAIHTYFLKEIKQMWQIEPSKGVKPYYPSLGF